MSKRTKKNAKTEAPATEVVVAVETPEAPVDAVIAVATLPVEEAVEAPKRQSRSIVPHSYKTRYAAHDDSNGDEVAAAMAEATKGADGKTDLAALVAIAAQNGIDATKYSHLNPGQQRMNVGNKLRTMVRLGEAVSIGTKTWATKSLDAKVA